MAPQNLNQVFVANSTAPALTSGAFSQAAASGLATNSKFGIWNVKGNAYLDGATVAASLMTSAGVLNTALTSVQFTQTMLSGNVIASPIIDIKDIKRIAVSKFEATQRHEVECTFATTVPASQSFMFRIAVRTYPTIYEAFANPNNPALDLSGTDGKIFPLLGNFSAGRSIISVVEIPAGTTVANSALAVRNAIQNNETLNRMFTASVSAGVVTITARHMGVVFDVACNNTQTYSEANGFSTAVTGFDEGSGHFISVLSEEKAQRARYGNFNRMYFPMNFPTFAQSGTSYDAIDISYAHNWPSSTGIARAGELNNIRIYFPTAIFSATNVDTVFCFTDTNFQAALNVGAGVTEYYF
jgi:hypothetical protein